MTAMEEFFMKKERNSSLELIRILCVFYIVYWHAIGPYLSDMFGTANFVPVSLINSFCNTTNTLFILLTGYFGIKFGLEKLIKLDVAIIFYGIVHLFVAQTFGAKDILFALLPITFKQHWFLTCYFVIAFLSPFINKIPEKLSRTAFRNLLLLLIGIFFLMPTIFFYEIIEDTGKGVVCMLIIYLVGRYIRLYYDDLRFKARRLVVLFLLLIAVATVLDVALSIVRGDFMGMYCRDNSVFMLAASIVFFMIFKQMHFTNRVINHLTQNVVILYVIEGYVREVVDRFFSLSDYVSHPAFIAIVLGYAVVVIVICFAVNELRTLIFGRLDGWLAAKLNTLIMRLFHWSGGVAQKGRDGLIRLLTAEDNSEQ